MINPKLSTREEIECDDGEHNDDEVVEGSPRQVHSHTDEGVVESKQIKTTINRCSNDKALYVKFNKQVF